MSETVLRGLRAVTSDVASGAVGTILYWKLGATTAYDELVKSWENNDLREVLGEVVSAPTPDVALTRALGEQKTARRLVRKLAGTDGHAIVSETVEPGRDPQYSTLVKVRLGDNLKPSFDPSYSDLAPEIRSAFRRHLDTILATDLSTWLVELTTKLDAVKLKETGGMYFIPAGKAALAHKVALALRPVGTTIYEIPAMDAESATVAFVDAITDEVKAVAAGIMDEIATGKLGERALSARAATAKNLAEKVKRYEALLGTSMSDLQAQITQISGAVASAALVTAA